ncbi:MAG: hypothetical protein AB1Z98_32920 [Nannocystaceae bacterium]
MRHILQELRLACLPFVTRALRGSRRRRFTVGSALVALLVILLGTTVGQSSGPMAHDMRVSLGLEISRWDRQDLDFIVFVEDERARARVLQDWGSGRTETLGRYEAEAAWLLLDAVANPEVIAPETMQPLQQRARALRDSRPDLVPEDLEQRRQYQHFDWGSPRDQRRLRAIVDAELMPRVEVYRSPLDAAATVRLVGGLAGAVLMLLGLLLAPLWVALSLAQELHDNTLQPLTGTALTARQLVIGIIAGALSPVLLFGAPLLALSLGAAAVAGQLIPALGFVVMTLAMGAMLIGLSMLVALAVGRRRAPGIVGIGLAAALGLAGMLGLTMGLHLRSQSLGVVTIMPAAGPGHLLAEAFFPVNHLHAPDAFELALRLALATVGALVLGGLALRAIERIVGGTQHDGALSRAEGMLAAAFLVVLATAAIPVGESFGPTMLGAVAVALLPLQLVLMGRVPGGDVPPSRRRVPVASLLGENAAWLVLAGLASVLVAGGPDSVRAGGLFGVMHVGWAVVVMAFITLRAAALPTSIPAKLWLLVCAGFVMIEYGTGAVWCLDDPGLEMVFPLANAAPLLGLVHVGMFVWIPVSLLRAFVGHER